MSRLFIGLSIGLLGLVGMGLGGALDATPAPVTCRVDCSHAAPVTLAESGPKQPGEG